MPYYDILEILAEKPISTIGFRKKSSEKKEKAGDYLFYRGWESELVYGKINEIVA